MLIITVSFSVYVEKLLPSWPNDFSWNTDGIPEACACKKDECDCHCVNIAEPADSHAWRDNYLCFSKTKYLPDIKWSHSGMFFFQTICLLINESNCNMLSSLSHPKASDTRLQLSNPACKYSVQFPCIA